MTDLAAMVASTRQAERQRADLWSNVADAARRKLPGVPHRNLRSRPFALVAGGPSLRETWPLIAGLENPFVIAINDTHEFLRERGVRFDACALSEVMPKDARLFGNVQRRVGYYVASQAHPTTFERLLKEGAKVWQWHLDQPGVRDMVAEYAMQGPIVPGGTSCPARMANLAVHGWRARDVHIFGLDSSFADQTHAYENRTHYETHTLRVAGRDFGVNSFLAKQALTFIDQLKHWPKDVNLTFHGDGLLPHAVRSLAQPGVANADA